MKLQKQKLDMNFYMEPLGDLLTTRPIQNSWVITFTLYPKWWFWLYDNLDTQFANSLVAILTRTWSNCLEQISNTRWQYPKFLTHNQASVQSTLSHGTDFEWVAVITGTIMHPSPFIF
jgi:hypothetical protein